MKPINKLLVIRLSALGDICMVLPVLDAACKSHPEVSFTFLTSKVGAIIASTVLHHDNLKIRSINKKDYNGISGMNRLYKEMKSLNIDAVADLHDVIRTKWVRFRFLLNGYRVETIDKGRSEKKALLSHAIHRQLTTSIARYQDVFTRLGLEFNVDYDGKLVREDLLKHLSEFGKDTVDNELSIGIAPFAQHEGKVYPAPKMRETIDLLLKELPSLKIYLFGSREEQSVLDVWAAAYPEQVINLAGKQSISDDLNLMCRLKLMISMDSANMHLASLVGLRCISIWGATHRYAGFLGYNQSEEDCVELPLSCRPCSIYGNKPCKQGDYQCLNGIRPALLANNILNALK